nr:immunoglobulin light chain junction region [Macaca mulatta]
DYYCCSYRSVTTVLF